MTSLVSNEIDLDEFNVKSFLVKENRIFVGNDEGMIKYYRASTKEALGYFELGYGSALEYPMDAEGDLLVVGAFDNVAIFEYDGENYIKSRSDELDDYIKHVVVKNGIIVGHDEVNLSIDRFTGSKRLYFDQIHSVTIKVKTIIACVTEENSRHIVVLDKFGNMRNKIDTGNKALTQMYYDVNLRLLAQQEYSNILQFWDRRDGWQRNEIEGTSIAFVGTHVVSIGSDGINIYPPLQNIPYPNISLDFISGDGPYVAVVYKDGNKSIVDINKIPELLKGTIKVKDQYYKFGKHDGLQRLDDRNYSEVREVNEENSTVKLDGEKSFVEVYDNYQKRPKRLDTDMKILASSDEYSMRSFCDTNGQHVAFIGGLQEPVLVEWETKEVYYDWDPTWTDEENTYSAMAIGRDFLVTVMLSDDNNYYLNLRTMDGTSMERRTLTGDVDTLALNGNHLAVATDRKIEVMYIDGGNFRDITSIDTPFQSVGIVSMMWNDGDIIIAGKTVDNKGRVYIFSSEKIFAGFQPRPKWLEVGNDIQCMDAHGDRLVVGVHDNGSEIIVCSMATMEVIQQIYHSDEAINSISIRGGLMVSTNKKEIKCWNIDVKDDSFFRMETIESGDIIKSTIYENYLFVVYEDGDITRESLPPVSTSKIVEEAQVKMMPDGQVISCLAMGRGHIYTGFKSGKVYSWKLMYTDPSTISTRFIENSKDHNGEEVSAIYVGSNKVISLSMGAMLIHTISGFTNHSIEGNFDGAAHLSIYMNKFALAKEDKVTFFDIYTGSEISPPTTVTLGDEPLTITEIAYNKGILAIGTDWGQVIVTDEGLNTLFSFKLGDNSIFHLDIYGSSIIGTDSRNNIFRIDINTRKKKKFSVRSETYEATAVRDGLVASIGKKNFSIYTFYDRKLMLLEQDEFLDSVDIDSHYCFDLEGHTMVFGRQTKMAILNWTPDADPEIDQDEFVSSMDTTEEASDTLPQVNDRLVQEESRVQNEIQLPSIVSTFSSMAIVGRGLFGATGKNIVAIDMQNGEVTTSVEAHDSPIKHMVTGTRKVISATEREIKIWEFKNSFELKKVFGAVGTTARHSGDITDMDIHGDTLVTVSKTKEIKIWHTGENPRLLGTYSLDFDNINHGDPTSVAIYGDRAYYGTSLGYIGDIDLTTGDRIDPIPMPLEDPNNMSITDLVVKDGVIAYCCSEAVGLMKLNYETIRLHSYDRDARQIDLQGTRLAVRYDDKIQIIHNEGFRRNLDAKYIRQTIPSEEIRNIQLYGDKLIAINSTAATLYELEKSEPIFQDTRPIDFGEGETERQVMGIEFRDIAIDGRRTVIIDKKAAHVIKTYQKSIHSTTTYSSRDLPDMKCVDIKGNLIVIGLGDLYYNKIVYGPIDNPMELQITLQNTVLAVKTDGLRILVVTKGKILVYHKDGTKKKEIPFELQESAFGAEAALEDNILAVVFWSLKTLMVWDLSDGTLLNQVTIPFETSCIAMQDGSIYIGGAGDNDEGQVCTVGWSSPEVSLPVTAFEYNVTSIDVQGDIVIACGPRGGGYRVNMYQHNNSTGILDSIPVYTNGETVKAVICGNLIGIMSDDYRTPVIKFLDEALPGAGQRAILGRIYTIDQFREIEMPETKLVMDINEEDCDIGDVDTKKEYPVRVAISRNPYVWERQGTSDNDKFYIYCGESLKQWLNSSPGFNTFGSDSIYLEDSVKRNKSPFSNAVITDIQFLTQEMVDEEMKKYEEEEEEDPTKELQNKLDDLDKEIDALKKELEDLEKNQKRIEEIKAKLRILEFQRRSTANTIRIMGMSSVRPIARLKF